MELIGRFIKRLLVRVVVVVVLPMAEFDTLAAAKKIPEGQKFYKQTTTRKVAK